jgi:hypothetical protein
LLRIRASIAEIADATPAFREVLQQFRHSKVMVAVGVGKKHIVQLGNAAIGEVLKEPRACAVELR